MYCHSILKASHTIKSSLPKGILVVLVFPTQNVLCQNTNIENVPVFENQYIQQIMAQNTEQIVL